MMKKKLYIAVILLAFLAIIICILFNAITRKSVDWDFIQKVGGITIGTPLETYDGYYLPVICNVSGTDSVNVKPTTINSALSCLHIKTKIKGDKIYLNVIAGVSITKHYNCKCKAVNIGYLEPGNYTVYYKDKTSFEHQIGAFTVKDY
jgi:hypothetical protein